MNSKHETRPSNRRNKKEDYDQTQEELPVRTYSKVSSSSDDFPFLQEPLMRKHSDKRSFLRKTLDFLLKLFCLKKAQDRACTRGHSSQNVQIYIDEFSESEAGYDSLSPDLPEMFTVRVDGKFSEATRRQAKPLQRPAFFNDRTADMNSDQKEDPVLQDLHSLVSPMKP